LNGSGINLQTTYYQLHAIAIKVLFNRNITPTDVHAEIQNWVKPQAS